MTGEQATIQIMLDAYRSSGGDFWTAVAAGNFNGLTDQEAIDALESEGITE